MLRKTLCVGLLAALAGPMGCTTALKQGYYTVTGAKGEFYETKVVSPDDLARYESLQVEPFTNSLGPHLPSQVVTAVNQKVQASNREEGLFPGGGRPLRVTGEFVHFTGESGLGGSVQSIIGGSEVCVCRVHLNDAQTGEPIGEAVCWGTVKSAIRRGHEELAEGVAKGIRKWLQTRMPKEVAEARRAGGSD